MYRYVLPSLVLALVPGCGLLSVLLRLDQESGSSELKAFKSRQELADYFTVQVNARQSGFLDQNGGLWFAPESGLPGTEDAAGVGGAPDAAPPRDGGTGGGEGAAADSSESEFSQTTIQEEGVDEADVVKTDGNYVYVIHSGGNDGKGLLRIVDMSPPLQLAQRGELTLQGYGREIYLHDGKVVALTENYGGYFHVLPMETVSAPTEVIDSEEPVSDGGDDEDGVATDADIVAPDGVMEYEYERPSTVVTIIESSDPANPVVLSETTFEGTQVSSRMIDGVLHLALANYQDYLYGVMPGIGEPRVVLSETDVDVLIPDFERVDGDGETSGGDMVTWREMYHPVDPDGFGLVTLVSLDVDNDAQFTAVGVVAQPGLVYSSLDAFYLTDTGYDVRNEIRETTDIYRFAYVGRGAEPRATGSVPGRVLNQYSMGEYEGYLRVATTIEGGFTAFFERIPPKNAVYVLGETTGEPDAGTGEAQTTGRLGVIGRIEDIAVGEQIRSARFIAERGYLVTFEQIDPLFTLDLSDPTNPQIVGELKVPGFSTFLVPMDQDHLLAVGQYIPEQSPFGGWGVQLTIFDVSNFAEPTELDKVVLGADGDASSEALYNPKAFTYFAERGLVALPATINTGWWFLEDVDVGIVRTGEGEGDDSVPVEPPPDDGLVDDMIAPPIPQGFEGLVVFSVSVEEGINELGRISTVFDESAGWWWTAFTRGVFIGDDVFAVTDRGVRGASIADASTVLYELPFN